MTVDKYVIEDYEQRDLEQQDRINNLAADLLEERSQRADLARRLNDVQAERDGLQEKFDALHLDTDLTDALVEFYRLRRRFSEAVDLVQQRSAERDEARAEVVRLGRSLEEWKALAEIERLRTIIGELGAAEAAEPPTDEVEAWLRAANDQLLADLDRTVDVEASLAEVKRAAAELAKDGCPAHGVHPHDGMRCLDCPECMNDLRARAGEPS